MSSHEAHLIAGLRAAETALCTAGHAGVHMQDQESLLNLSVMWALRFVRLAKRECLRGSGQTVGGAEEEDARYAEALMQFDEVASFEAESENS